MRVLTIEELSKVSGAGEEPSCTPKKGNNGWGNGEDAAPGNSLANQPKFEDPNTTTSPSNSAASGGGNR